MRTIVDRKELSGVLESLAKLASTSGNPQIRSRIENCMNDINAMYAGEASETDYFRYNFFGDTTLACKESTR